MTGPTLSGSTADQATPDAAWWGTVTAVQANFYRVRLDQPPTPTGPDSLLCVRRALLKKTGQQVAVGDRVAVVEPDWQGQRGAIAALGPRRSWLDRPPIANVDQVLLVFALAEPDLDPHQLSRFLVKAESTGLAVQLCLNKADLVDEAQREQWRSRLLAWGYEPILTNLAAPDSPGAIAAVETLQPILVDRTTIIAGPSGAGKSSTINALIPAAGLRVAAVSGKLGRGRHTTRHVELFPLPGGGLLADSPGFNQPSLDLPPTELPQLFPEIRRALAHTTCHYADCLHRDEPGCGVGQAWERHEFYCRLLAEADRYQDTTRKTSEADPRFKQKSRADGRASLEPRLLAKKYRRQSRRSQNQTAPDDDLGEEA